MMSINIVFSVLFLVYLKKHTRYGKLYCNFKFSLFTSNSPLAMLFYIFKFIDKESQFITKTFQFSDYKPTSYVVTK